MPSHQPTTADISTPRRKAILFCPNCGHESDVAGDWNVRTDGEHRIYDCPDCGTRITRRTRDKPLLSP